jgi:hypothetical protein
MIPLNLVIIFFVIAFVLPPTYKTFIAILAILYASYFIQNKKQKKIDNLYDPILFFSKYDDNGVIEICDKLEKFYYIKEKLEEEGYPYKANNIKTAHLLRADIINLLGGITHSLHGEAKDNIRLKKTIKYYKEKLLKDIIYMVNKHNHPEIKKIDFSNGCIDFIGVEPNDPKLNKNLDLL